MPDASIDLRDRLVQHYDEKYAEERSQIAVFPHVRHPMNRFEACVAHVMESFTGGRVLEIGGGDGVLARSLLAAGLPCSLYVMTDLSAARVKHAAELLADPRLSTAVLDIDAPPSASFADLERMADGGFDCVLLVATVEHLVDPIGALRRIRELLVPGGFLYVMTPNIAKWTRRIRLVQGRFPSTASTDEGLRTYEGGPVDLHDEGHLHYFTYRSLSRLLVEYAGFSSCRYCAYWEGPRRVPPRVGDLLARARPQLFSELALVAVR